MAEANADRSMGTWFFDKRSRKRKYVALTGKVYTGGEAMRIARYDAYSPTHPTQFLRSQLIYHVQSINVASLSAAHAAGSSSFQDLSQLSAWGLPEQLVREYAQHKVTKLFPWQISCLLSDGGKVLDGRNLIFSAPTSGGKTLIAELLMLRKMASNMVLGDPKDIPRKTVLFVVPFIALAEEKAAYLRSVWRCLGIGIKTFHGNDSSNQLLTPDVEVAICTIERANILLNQLLIEKREGQLAMVVIDEIHLLADRHRGFLLEVLLTKINYLLPTLQVVGMSATLPNIAELAGWLRAALFRTDFRPVDLQMLVCRDKKIYEVQYNTPYAVPAAEDVVMNIYGEVSNCSNASGSGLTAQSFGSYSHASCEYGSENSTSNSTLFQYVMNSTAASSVYDVCDAPSDSADYGGCGVSTTAISSSATICSYSYGKGMSANYSEQLLEQTHLQGQRKQSAVMTSNTTAVYVTAPSSSSKTAHLHHLQDLYPLPAEEDSDGLKAICVDYVQQTKSVLVFCSSKKKCEVAAKGLSASIQRHCHDTIGQSVAQIMDPKKRTAGQRMALLESLANASSCTICPILQQSIMHGVAYHHAGLAQEERQVIEQGFRSGVLSILCTTSTLSAGVNLPAHAVIIRSLSMGDTLLSVSSFRQMCGRAGRLNCVPNRPGHLSAGDSMATELGQAVIMLGSHSAEYTQLQHLLCADYEPLSSGLAPSVRATDSNRGIERLLLEMICTGRLQAETQVLSFLLNSFLAQKISAEELYSLAKDAVVFLKREQFVLLSSISLCPSPLGAATMQSGLSPQDALDLLPILQQAKRKLVLNSALHLVFLIVPPSSKMIEPDWQHYELLVDKLIKEHPEAQLVVDYLGIQKAALCSFMFQKPSPTSAAGKLYKRFYIAVVLFAVIQEWPVAAVLQLLHTINRGQLQQLQRDAAIYCAMVAVFCQKLNWSLLASCLEDLGGRLGFGVQRELLPLVRIGPEVSALRARLLHGNGLQSARDILTAGEDKVADILVRALPYQLRDALGRGSKDSGGDGNGRGKEYQSCLRLANTIVRKSGEYIQQEMQRRCV